MVLKSLGANLIACTSIKQGIGATYGRGMVDMGVGLGALHDDGVEYS